MAQVVAKKHLLPDNIRGALQSLGPHGVGPAVWDRNQLEIARAMKLFEREEQAFAMQSEDRARRIQFEDQDRQKQDAYDKLDMLAKKRGILSAEQSGRDSKRMAEATPFDLIARSPNLPEPIAKGIDQARGVYSKLETDGARKSFLETMLPGISKAIDQHQRQEMSAGIADRLSRGAYGEDEGVSEGLKGLQELIDSGAPLQQVAAADMKLRQSMAESGAKMAKKQRILAALQQEAAVLPPGPQADHAEQALFDYQHELIDEKTAGQRMFEAKTGEFGMFQKSLRPEQLYLEAARAANQMFTGSKDRNPEKVAEMADVIFRRMMALRQGSSEGGGESGPVDAMGPLRNAAGQSEPGSATMSGVTQPAEAGAPPATPGSPSSGTGGAPATPTKAVEKARELTGESSGNSGQLDRASAIKQAEEAARAGASDAELRKLLEAAGIDPDAPASSLEEPKPKRKRRQAEHVGPNV